MESKSNAHMARSGDEPVTVADHPCSAGSVAYAAEDGSVRAHVRPVNEDGCTCAWGLSGDLLVWDTECHVHGSPLAC